MAPNDTAPPIPQQGTFVTVLRASEDRALLDELNDRMRELVATMHQEQTSRGGKPKGALSVAFGLQLDHTGVMEISATVSVKEPKTERSRTIFYRTSDNSLSPKLRNAPSMTATVKPDAPLLTPSPQGAPWSIRVALLFVGIITWWKV